MAKILLFPVLKMGGPGGPGYLDRCLHRRCFGGPVRAPEVFHSFNQNNDRPGQQDYEALKSWITPRTKNRHRNYRLFKT